MPEQHAFTKIFGTKAPKIRSRLEPQESACSVWEMALKARAISETKTGISKISRRTVEAWQQRLESKHGSKHKSLATARGLMKKLDETC
jgi:hypothetical protein